MTRKYKKNLTEQQQQFVVNYVTNGFNAQQAAKDADYSDYSAQTRPYQLLQKPEIQQRIAKARTSLDADFEEKMGITIRHKCEMLLRIINDVLPADGTIPLRKHYDQAMRALDMLNKMQGHYAPDKRLAVTVDATKERLLEAKRVYEDY